MKFQPNLDKLMVLNIAMLLLWSSFNTSQNLASQVLEDNGLGALGNYSLSLLYFTQVIVSFFATPIVKKLGYKFIFFVGGLTYTLYVATFILPAYRHEYPNDHQWYFNKTFVIVFILVCVVINGAGSALLWVQLGNYISECANESNKGQFNAIFWCFLMTSGIVGNLMAAYVIADVKQSMFYIVMTGLCFLSNLVFLLIKKPNPQPVIAEVTKDLAIGASLKESMPSVLQNQEPEFDVKRDLIETFRLLKQKRMLKLAPLWIWTSVSNSCIATIFVPFMTKLMENTPGSADWDPDIQQRHCLLAMVGCGFGEIIGAIAYGYVQDKYQSRAAAVLCFVTCTLSIASSLGLAIYYEFSFAFAIVMCFLWGAEDAMTQCYALCLCGFQFDDQTIPFCVYQIIQNIGSTSLYASSQTIKSKEDFIIYFSVLMLFNFLTYYFLIFSFDFRKVILPGSKQKNEQKSEARENLITPENEPETKQVEGAQQAAYGQPVLETPKQD